MYSNSDNGNSILVAAMTLLHPTMVATTTIQLNRITVTMAIVISIKVYIALLTVDTHILLIISIANPLCGHLMFRGNLVASSSHTMA